MTLVLQKGRPADTTGRLDKEIRTYDLLDSLGVEYDRVDHAPAMTMEDCKEVDEILESMVCKNLFLCNRQETAFYLLMIPRKSLPIATTSLHSFCPSSHPEKKPTGRCRTA